MQKWGTKLRNANDATILAFNDIAKWQCPVLCTCKDPVVEENTLNLRVARDTDPGVDDVLALLLALSSAELSVRAIALTHGNTTLPKALNNLRKLFYALHLHLEAFPDERSRWPGLSSKIDVFLGDQKPIKGEPAVAAYFHGQYTDFYYCLLTETLTRPAAETA